MIKNTRLNSYLKLNIRQVELSKSKRATSTGRKIERSTRKTIERSIEGRTFERSTSKN